jgi:phage head maturation protease
MKLTKKDKLNMPFAVKSQSHSAVSFKEVDTSARTVDFIGNTYYWIDSYGDVLIPGCCAKSIQDRGPDSKLPGKIKHLSNHNLDKGIGRMEVIEETKFEGMDVLRAQSFMSETQLGEETLTKYNEGIIDQHSIGFRYMQLEWIDSEADGWEEWLGKLINPEDAESKGYMWIVPGS